MTDPQTLFNQLLEAYKNAIEDYDEALTLYREGKAPRPKWFPLMHNESYIKIMESGIFHKGCLKGKKLTVSGPPDYLTYPILDLEKLIGHLSYSFSRFNFYDRKISVRERLERDFDILLRLFDKIMPYLKEYKIAKGSEIKVKNQLIIWRNKLIKKFNDNVPLIYGEEVFHPPEYSLEDYIADCLAWFVPEAPALRLAKRTNDLLHYMGKNRVNERTLRHFISRQKKRHSLAKMQKIEQENIESKNKH